MKKLLKLAMVAAMVAGVAAGCSKSETPNEGGELQMEEQKA